MVDHFEFDPDEKKIVMSCPSLKPHILLNRNGLAIWHGFPDIRLIKLLIADSQPLCI